MSPSKEIKKIRKRCFPTQEEFAKEIKVSFLTVSRWESGKMKPNLSAMNNIKAFCIKNNVEYSPFEDS